MFSRVSALLGLMALCIYLFVTAPPPLEDGGQVTSSATVSIAKAFTVLAVENDGARKIWTDEIVGAGQKVGLRFDEHWADEGMEAGPLPALFLAETARQIQRISTDLTLSLGSDAPIVPKHLFRGPQATAFATLRATGAPQFFEDADLGRQVAMFPDLASAAACVTCHNAHEDSPRHDWVLGEIMGATTWTYPRASVSLAEILELAKVYRAGTRRAYERYLERAGSFEVPPEIGDRWPRDGERVLPSADEFMRAVEGAVSSRTVEALFEAARAR
ncbi:MAG: DUF3365 domain-containing protein [Planctomycetota bacterium]|nr:DUF3365 domain-containing protein [Planctomycetota bacterium]MDG1984414.1 DUF3365 domain-containing protein [Planctomycetota bacterium]